MKLVNVLKAAFAALGLASAITSFFVWMDTTVGKTTVNSFNTNDRTMASANPLPNGDPKLFYKQEPGHANQFVGRAFMGNNNAGFGGGLGGFAGGIQGQFGNFPAGNFGNLGGQFGFGQDSGRFPSVAPGPATR